LALIPVINNQNEKEDKELGLLVQKSKATLAMGKFKVMEIQRLFSRMKTLVELTGRTDDLFDAMRGLSNHYIICGELDDGLKSAQKCLSIAEELGDKTMLSEAHRLLGWGHYFLGNFPECATHWEQSFQNYEAHKHSEYINRFSIDPGVFALSHISHVYWYLGYADKASRAIENAMELATQHNHPFSQVLCSFFLVGFHRITGRVDNILSSVKDTVKLATKHGLFGWELEISSTLGWAMVQNGEVVEGIKIIENVISRREYEGPTVARGYHFGILAESCIISKNYQRGIEAIDKAIELCVPYKDEFYISEIYRIKGDVLLASGFENSEIEAEKSFEKSIKYAKKQQANSVKLRSAIRLSKLWKKRGKKEKATKLLSEIYAWFTEGHDLPDLAEAKKLLADWQLVKNHFK
jgi:tetratricopeptide (TPR) repeat protein